MNNAVRRLRTRPRRLNALLIVVFAAVSSGCSRSGITIEIVVPNDFTGAVEVIPNQTDGVSPIWNGNTVTLPIPQSGVLKLSGNDPFGRWHQIDAHYEDGRPIGHFGSRSDAAERASAVMKNNIYIASCGAINSSHRASPYYLHYIGPPEECEAAEKASSRDLGAGKRVGNTTKAPSDLN